MKYDFDRVIDRRGTNSEKWDFVDEIYGGEDLLPLWVADTDFESPPEVVDAIVLRAKHGMYGYTRKPDSAYEAVADWMEKRHHWQVEPGWVKFTTGVKTALNLSVLAFTHPGDKVIVQAPVYGPFFRAVQHPGRHVVNNSLLLVNGRYEMDPEDFEKRIDSRVKMVILCNPHNPVGRVWTKAELERLGEICLRHGLIIVSDEVHSDFVYRGHKHIPIASVSEELAQITVTTVAPSKTFNLAGLASAAVIIPNERLRRTFQNAMESCGSKTNLFGVLALEAAYRYGEAWLEELLVYLQGNLDLLVDFVAEHMREVKVVRPEGTYLVWLDCRGLPIAAPHLNEFFVKKAGVALNDGSEFGPGGEGFQRLNIGCPRSILIEGLSRMALALYGQ